MRWRARRGARYRTPAHSTFLYSSSATMAVITSNGMLIRFLTSFARVSCSRFAPLRQLRSWVSSAVGLRRNPVAESCRSSSTRHSLVYSWGVLWGSRPCVSGARPGMTRASPATSFGCVSEATRGLHLAALPGWPHHIFSSAVQVGGDPPLGTPGSCDGPVAIGISRLLSPGLRLFRREPKWRSCGQCPDHCMKSTLMPSTCGVTWGSLCRPRAGARERVSNTLSAAGSNT